MIIDKGKIVTMIRDRGRLLTRVMVGTRLVWQAVRSCFGAGWWRDDKPWSDNEIWKD